MSNHLLNSGHPRQNAKQTYTYIPACKVMNCTELLALPTPKAFSDFTEQEYTVFSSRTPDKVNEVVLLPVSITTFGMSNCCCVAITRYDDILVSSFKWSITGLPVQSS